MGGLLVRYAVGVLYDPQARTVAGLTPCHFITMATPHAGCDADGLSQVGWCGAVVRVDELVGGGAGAGGGGQSFGLVSAGGHACTSMKGSGGRRSVGRHCTPRGPGCRCSFQLT